MRDNGASPGQTRPLRILFVSDGIWHITGYGVTTEYLTRRMASDGHKVYIYAPGAFHGGKVEHPDGRVSLSSGFTDDRWGNNTLLYHLQWVDPDVIITWVDCQGLVEYGWTEHPVFMYAPIDAWPVPQQESAILGRAARILVPSEWGQKVLADQDIVSDYIPCGIDMDTYRIDPEGRIRWRKQIQPSIDDRTFLIGSVGLNSGAPDRKGYGFEFDAIKEFASRHKDVRVYIHTNVEGDGMAINLLTLRKEMGLEDVICFSRPPGPLGEGERYMRDMYNAFDVLLHCGVSEGFGLPIIEAQACGTPVVANACTSITELLSPLCYPCEPLADMIVNTCCRVALPSVGNIVDGLEQAYEDWHRKPLSRLQVRQQTMRFNQDDIYGRYWRDVLDSVPPRLDFRAGERKLMLAAGQDQREGFVHHDKEKFFPHIDVAHDLTQFPWPWEDDSWDYIDFSDCLEHLRVELVDVMDELWRVTAPEGFVYIHTAETGSWQLMLDPTHVQGFMLASLDYFDPETRYGEHYSYTERKWRIHRRTIDNGGLTFVLSPRKEKVGLEPKLLEAVT